MNMTEIRRRARDLGLVRTSKLKKGELIRRIQQAEGNPACYASADRFGCPQADCLWRKNCLTQRPG